MKKGDAYLFSFPFWLYVDRRDALGTCDASFGPNLIRFYPPFRSAPANFSPIPGLVSSTIPFEPGAAPSRPLAIVNVAVLPLLEADGGPGSIIRGSPKWDKPPAIFPMDSIRIDVVGPMSAKFSTQPLLLRLLSHLRLRTRQWWILRSAAVLLSYDRARFDIAENGAAIGAEFSNRSYGRIPFGFETGISNPIWMNCVEAAVRELEVPLYEMSLLDAFYFVAANDIRTAVMHAAAALEQAISENFTRLWIRKGPKKFRRGFLTGRTATVHISTDMDKYFARSFSREFPRAFEQLEKLWRVRVGAGLAGVYTFLYITLRQQDYALLMGAVGLFIVLAVVMYVTRKVDWYARDAS
jgi:hypothetical protein